MIPENIMQIFELSYYASGVFLLIVGIIGLKQLSLMKSESRIRSKREAATEARDQTCYYIDNIIPRILGLKKQISIVRYKELENTFVSFKKSEFYENRNEKEIEQWRKTIIQNLKEKDKIEITNILCKLDSVANSFINGVADEETAFSSIGHDFCDIVLKLSPLISWYRDKNIAIDNYDNIISLFKVWNSRINGHKAQRESESLDQKSKDLKELAKMKKRTSKANLKIKMMTPLGA